MNLKKTNEKKRNRLLSVIAFTLLAVLSLLLVSCNGGGEDEPTFSDTLSVKVTDEIGRPINNVMVKLTVGDAPTKSSITNKEGIATFKDLSSGERKITIEQGFSNAVVDATVYTVDEKSFDYSIALRDRATTSEIWGAVPDGSYAYAVSEGSYGIFGVEDGTRYLIFRASSKGCFRISIDSPDGDTTVGYYGDPNIVLENHIGDGEYDGKSFELNIHDTATPYVIGVSFASDENVTLLIERIGDAPFDPQYAPWTEVPATESFIDVSTGTLVDLDVTDPALSVTLGSDGYYYTSDGKLVYLRIKSTSLYLDTSIALIAGCVDDNVGQNFGGYVYDDEGNFLAKYTYNTMLAAYTEHCDSNGVYPLTEELAEAVKTHGNSIGWWRPGTVNYLFDGVNVVLSNAWLFLCCTEQ